MRMTLCKIGSKEEHIKKVKVKILYHDMKIEIKQNNEKRIDRRNI